MKIAVTCENGRVFQHFGHTPGFAVFEIENGEIVSEKQLSSGDSGHGALANVLAFAQVELLICGGIGGGAINALNSAGIEVIGGAEGDVQEVVKSFIAGNLRVRENFHCNHHHHDGNHTCGDHGCGSGSCAH